MENNKDITKEELKMIQKEQLFEKIEDEVGYAYEVGYFHAKGEKSSQGWGTHFENIKALVNNYIDNNA